jgi:Flp pilus assembly protein TadD
MAESNVRRLELLADGDDPEELIEIGQLFRANGDNDTAIEFFGRAVETDPESFQTWANLAAGLDEVGRHHPAARAYERALELQPDSAAARVIEDRLQRLSEWLDNCKINGEEKSE